MTAEVTDRGTDRKKRRVTNRKQSEKEKIPEELDTTTLRIVKRGRGKRNKT